MPPINASRADYKIVFLSVLSRALGLICVLSLSACGFTLKAASAPLPFKIVQLQSQANSYIAADVSARLLAKGLQLSTDPKASVPKIALLNEARERAVLSTSAAGGVRQFQLVHRVTVQVYDSAARTWLAPVVYTQTRNLDYNPSQVLAKDLEEQALYKDMQQELVASVIRRVEATANTPLPTASPLATPL